MKIDPKNGYFKENITISQMGNEKPVTYFERALDKNGKWLKIGGWVRVVDYDGTQRDLRGLRRKIIGIFEGDLMLENESSYDYCWPRKTIKQ